jgi:crotonobetainyl-CoA:carnitine CoA-transferase CaiB-like acyl-CoA transferase
MSAAFHVVGVQMPGGELNRMKTAKKVVADYLAFDTDDIYIVWFCKTLQNWKALLSTDRIDTGIYFEVTYNGDKDELYLDHYAKVLNRAYMVVRTANAA